MQCNEECEGRLLLSDRLGGTEVSIERPESVSGTFPGSPVDLRYVFTLAGDKVSRLEIRS